MALKNQTILLTGGAGYIGSHTAVRLLQAGAKIVLLDNFCNSKPEVISNLESITKQQPVLVVGDIRDRDILRKLFESHKIDAVIHFAGLKAVGESVEDPLKYYNNNVYGSIMLLEEMDRAKVKTLVFSSSATVYGESASVSIAENSPLSPANPYGQSKLMVENILRDLHKADNSWRVAALRYFNPVGAHESGLIGEDPRGAPNNLVPFICQVAAGEQSKLQVFGNDYPTPDGTGIRDYIHVEDLADGHLAALSFLNKPGFAAVNLGTGRGCSVLEMIQTFEKVSGMRVSYDLAARRSGDVAVCYADPSLAKKLFDWEAKHGIERMCADAWRWQNMSSSRIESRANQLISSAHG